jgi:predicted Zn-dependent protease
MNRRKPRGTAAARAGSKPTAKGYDDRVRPITFIASILIAGFAAAAGPRAQELRLPDLGSSAEAIATPEELRRYGRQLLGSFRDAGMLFDDPLLDEYMQALGYRLVANADRPDLHFKFFLLKDRTVNAFAAPGGYIGTFAGMILMAQSEDELAAVTAHEIAHITQNHSLRGMESASKASIPIMLGMLAAMIAASQSGSASSGDAAQAAIMGGMGLMQQAQINYTRANEYEADRVGMQTLSRSGYDPGAVASLWGRMLRQSRNYGLSPPEILRTHPVETTRIAEAKARADAADPAVRIERPDPSGQRALDDRFELFQERIRVLLETGNDNLVGNYREQLREAPDDPFLRYGLAHALVRQEHWREAARLVESLLADHPDTLAFNLLAAEIDGRTGREQQARERYAALNARHPDRPAVVAPYAELLLRHGDADDARQAARLLRPLVDRDSDHAQVYALIGRAYELGGDRTRAAEAHALAAAYNGRFEDSLVQFERLQRRDDLDYYQRARVEARITELMPIVLEIRRRGLRPVGAG